METEEDKRLMMAVRGGDLDGMGILFEKYHAALVGFFRKASGGRLASEDLAQEVFWRILRYRKSYDERRPFRAWMYQIARNVMRDQFRKEATAGRVFDERVDVSTEGVARAECDVSGQVERGEQKELLRAALQRLPRDKRELIVLCRFEELPYVEIASVFGCSVGALKVRLFRALQDLKAVFLELEGEKAV